MFEFVTEYNKSLLVQYHKLEYKLSPRHNLKIFKLLTVVSFILGAVLIILAIVKPDTFKTTIPSFFFYISGIIFLINIYRMSDKGIKRFVDKVFERNPKLKQTTKYTFYEDHFESLNEENMLQKYNYNEVEHFEIFGDYIFLLLQGKKFIALMTNMEEVFTFLKNKISK